MVKIDPIQWRLIYFGGKKIIACIYYRYTCNNTNKWLYESCSAIFPIGGQQIFAYWNGIEKAAPLKQDVNGTYIRC